MRMNFRKIAAGFLNIILPPLCLICKKRTANALCKRCETKIDVLNAFYCPRCRRRLVKSLRCPVCKTPQALSERFILAAASSYQNEVVRELIHLLKYKQIKIALAPLTAIINTYLNKILRDEKLKIENYVIVPIPLHPRRERKRGFNQAAIIAEIVRQYLKVQSPNINIEIETGNLIRIKNTKSQIKLKNHEERKKNIDGCFAVSYPERIAGQNIILIDDVFTSGATMREAVKVLKEAGAKKIIGFVVAKA